MCACGGEETRQGRLAAGAMCSRVRARLLWLQGRRLRRPAASSARWHGGKPGVAATAWDARHPLVNLVARDAAANALHDILVALRVVGLPDGLRCATMRGGGMRAWGASPACGESRSMRASVSAARHARSPCETPSGELVEVPNLSQVVCCQFQGLQLHWFANRALRYEEQPINLRVGAVVADIRLRPAARHTRTGLRSCPPGSCPLPAQPPAAALQAHLKIKLRRPCVRRIVLLHAALLDRSSSNATLPVLGACELHLLCDSVGWSRGQRRGRGDCPASRRLRAVRRCRRQH